MAVHNLGYRPWRGQRAAGWQRWMVIAATGIRRAWQSTWLRRMVFVAWLPALWFAMGFFVWEQSLIDPQWRRGLETFVLQLPQDGSFSELLTEAISDDPEQARHTVWSGMLLSFFRYPQGVLMVLVVGIIAPPLISQDVRSRAFLLYFSRPTTRAEYVFGKSATLWFYLAMIATAPALSLYALGILLSPEISVVAATWDLPLRILASSTVLMIPTAALALCISSWTEESRYAAFGWFTACTLGWFTYGMMSSVEASQGVADPGARWAALSLYHALGAVQSWIFGFTDFDEAKTEAFVLVVLTVVSLTLLSRRVNAPMRR